MTTSPTAIPMIKHASAIECQIVGRLVTDLLGAGYAFTIWNGGDEAELDRSTDAEAIFAALAASDQDEIILYKGGHGGWIRLVWGNDCSVISDYTTNLDPLLAAANALADKLEG